MRFSDSSNCKKKKKELWQGRNISYERSMLNSLSLAPLYGYHVPCKGA